MFKGHRVHIGIIRLKVPDFNFIVHKRHHCAPNINEMTPISIQHVRDIVKHELCSKNNTLPINFRFSKCRIIMWIFLPNFKWIALSCPEKSAKNKTNQILDDFGGEGLCLWSRCDVDHRRTSLRDGLPPDGRCWCMCAGVAGSRTSLTKTTNFLAENRDFLSS